MRVLIVVLLVVGCTAKYKAATQASGGQVSRLRSDNATAGRRLTGLRNDKAVHHRRETSWQDIIATTAGATIGTSQPAPPPPAQPLDSPEPKVPEKLVIEAWLDMHTEKVSEAVEAIRARVVASGGRMVSENVHGSGTSTSSAALEFRVPPTQATSILAWLDTVGRVTNKRVLASDVSKTLFDQELALANLQLTMERLQKLAAASGPVAELLTIEKEMTRVRGEIETIKGEHRWLLDRVDLATITVSITRTGDDPYDYEDDIPEARVYPGPQLAMLTLFDPGMRQRTRFGGGASIRLQRYATFDLSVFPRGDGGDSRAVLATFGTALYSSYLRDGRRRYFNPYIGARVGYGYLSGDGKPVIAGEIGVEWFKHEYILFDTSVRILGYITDNAEAALHATTGLSVPF